MENKTSHALQALPVFPKIIPSHNHPPRDSFQNEHLQRPDASPSSLPNHPCRLHRLSCLRNLRRHALHGRLRQHSSPQKLPNQQAKPKPRSPTTTNPKQRSPTPPPPLTLQRLRILLPPSQPNYFLRTRAKGLRNKRLRATNPI